MRTPFRVGVVVALGLMLVGPLFAQVSLNRDTIHRWADSMEEIEAWGETSGLPEDDADSADEMGFDAMDFEESFLRAAREHAQIRSIISRHGFRSTEQWAETGARILRAYGAMEMGEYVQDERREIEQQMQELRNNPHLDDHSREIMLMQMEQMLAMMEHAANAPPADVAAVRAERTRLNRLFAE